MDVIFVPYDFHLSLPGMYLQGNLFSSDKGRLAPRVNSLIASILNVVKSV